MSARVGIMSAVLALAGAAGAQIISGGGAAGGSGDIVGPASAADNAVCRFDGTTGKLLQSSAVTVDDTGGLSALGIIASGLTANAPVYADGSKALACTAPLTNGQVVIGSTGAAPVAASVAIGSAGTDAAWAAGAGTLTLNIPDAGASARGLVTTGAQTFAGAKSFSSIVTVPAGSCAAPGVSGPDPDSGIVPTTAAVNVCANGVTVAALNGGGLASIFANGASFGVASDGAANEIKITSSGIQGEGSTVDTSETVLAFGNATADATLTLTGTSVGVTVANVGDLQLVRTITAGGTTGNQTINKPSGTVNLAAAASSVTVTNSVVTANSICLAEARTNDATCAVKSVVPSSGAFAITMTAACTAETSVGFVCFN